MMASSDTAQVDLTKIRTTTATNTTKQLIVPVAGYMEGRWTVYAGRVGRTKIPAFAL
jgi:hypothetical protein